MRFDFINEWKYDFLTDTRLKRSLTDKQRDIRAKCNEKLLLFLQEYEECDF